MKKFINTIPTSFTILESLKKMDEIKLKLLIIVDGNIFKGVLSIGDIQRAIINQVDLNQETSSITRQIITVCTVEDSSEFVKAKMLELRTECMPIVNDSMELVDVIYWGDLFVNEDKKLNQFDLPIVIMAGGKGSRLKPLTNIIPKPLIPVGDKTIIETIMDSFIKHGSNRFLISVNYKSEFIKYYMNTVLDASVEVNYFEEDKPLGTAGSLHLLKDKIHETFFVSNCDILVDEDYSEILKYHKENKNELTVVAALKNISIPYGTIESGEEGLITSMTEKPELNYLINSGLYILEPHLISEIPENEFFHITNLINQLIADKRRVGVFPVSEKSWKDMGEWGEYFKFINLKF